MIYGFLPDHKDDINVPRCVWISISVSFQCLWSLNLVFHRPSVEDYPCLSIQTKSWIPSLKPRSNKQQFTKLHQTLFSDKAEYVLPPLFNLTVVVLCLVKVSSYSRINSMICQVINVNLRFLYGHMHGTIVFFDFCQILIWAKMRFFPKGCWWIRP